MWEKIQRIKHIEKSHCVSANGLSSVVAFSPPMQTVPGSNPVVCKVGWGDAIKIP